MTEKKLRSETEQEKTSSKLLFMLCNTLNDDRRERERERERKRGRKRGRSVLVHVCVSVSLHVFARV